MIFRKFAGILSRPFSSIRAGACPINTVRSTARRVLRTHFRSVWTRVLPLFSTSVHKFPLSGEKKGRAETLEGLLPAGEGGRRPDEGKSGFSQVLAAPFPQILR